MHSVYATNGGGTDFRKADIADVPAFTISAILPMVFDGYCGIKARRAVYVDVVKSEASQAIGEKTFRGGGRESKRCQLLSGRA